MPKYVNVITDKIDKLAAPFVIEADTAEVKDNECGSSWVTLSLQDSRRDLFADGGSKTAPQTETVRLKADTTYEAGLY